MKLKDICPLIITWHGLNHRVELSVNDIMEYLNSINYFRSIVDYLDVL